MATCFLTAPLFTEEDAQRESESLTEEERREAEDDMCGRNITGATSGAGETEEFLRSKLRELGRELDGLSPETKAWYLSAVKRDAVREDELILFLRRERYDPAAAARRLALYWEKRIQLFGDDIAFRPLSVQSSLVDEGDVRALSANYISLLPEKDVHGRSILFRYFCNHHRKKPKYRYQADNMLRVFWCICHEALRRNPRDPNCGAVVLVDLLRNSDMEQFDRKLCRKLWTAVKEHIPVRLAAVHCCHPPGVFKLIRPVLLHIMGKRLRQRFIVHWGSEKQVLTKLEEYGIPSGGLPNEMGGDVCCIRYVSSLSADDEDDAIDANASGSAASQRENDDKERNIPSEKRHMMLTSDTARPEASEVHDNMKTKALSKDDANKSATKLVRSSGEDAPFLLQPDWRHSVDKLSVSTSTSSSCPKHSLGDAGSRIALPTNGNSFMVTECNGTGTPKRRQCSMDQALPTNGSSDQGIAAKKKVKATPTSAAKALVGLQVEAPVQLLGQL